MLFRINMYRLRSQRAREVRRKLRYLAFVVLLLGICIVVSGLFIYAVAMTGRAVAARSERLDASNSELLAQLGSGDVNITDEHLSLFRTRAVQTKWSDILAACSRLAVREMWFTQLRLSEGSLIGGRGRVPGFQMHGRLRSGREEESLDRLMTFLATIRQDPLFQESFEEVQLVSSRWTKTADEEYLEFEIFCPLPE